MAPAADPITLEVVHNRLTSIVNEMGNITLRTARSPVVNTGRDFSCGLFNARAEMLAMGTSVPSHIFPMWWQLRNTLSRFEGEVRPGDIFAGNDPHDGGTHLNDVSVFLPIFSRDEVPVGFAVNRAHWYDVGGMVPGSLSGDAREIYQEGLRIPPIRIGSGNALDPNIVDLIMRNVRAPAHALGDLKAQIASCRVAADRVCQLIDRYGEDAVAQIWEGILDAAERRMKRLIRDLPDTEVVHEAYLDNDGVDLACRRIRAAVTVEGDRVTVDFAGTAPQSAGPLNVTRALAEGYAFGGVKAALDPKGPINAGAFRPIEVKVPSGSCLDAKPPAAGGGMAEVGQALIVTMVAFAGLVPDRVSAEEGAASNHQNVTLSRDGHEPQTYYDSLSCGGGARSHGDGLDFVRSIRSGNYRIPSIELIERLYPLVCTRHEFRTGSGGPGEFRGGVGGVREFRVLADGVLSVLGDHGIVPPAGVFGGERGSPTRWDVIRDGATLPVSEAFRSKALFQLKEGDVLRHATPGGGGWGDSLARDPERVLDDVLNRKVTRDGAESIYGVVLSPAAGSVDAELTRQRRAELAERRVQLDVEADGVPAFERGLRVAWIHSDLGRDLGARGRLAEVFSANVPNPLTVLVRTRADVARGALVIDEEACRDLALSGGEDALLRLIDDPSEDGRGLEVWQAPEEEAEAR